MSSYIGNYLGVAQCGGLCAALDLASASTSATFDTAYFLVILGNIAISSSPIPVFEGASIR
jgi:hypothetical protein